MKLIKVNLPEAVAAKVTPSGDEVVVIIKKNANTIIKVMESIDDVVGDFIEASSPLFHKLVRFFEELFAELPTFIDYHGKMYRLTQQPALGEQPDKVFYLLEDGFQGDKILFSAEGDILIEAKRAMRKRLKEEGYLN